MAELNSGQLPSHLLHTGLHGALFQKMATFITTAVRTSNFACCPYFFPILTENYNIPPHLSVCSQENPVRCSLVCSCLRADRLVEVSGNMSKFQTLRETKLSLLFNTTHEDKEQEAKRPSSRSRCIVSFSGRFTFVEGSACSH
jgi:hypothetical protein